MKHYSWVWLHSRVNKRLEKRVAGRQSESGIQESKPGHRGRLRWIQRGYKQDDITMAAAKRSLREVLQVAITGCRERRISCFETTKHDPAHKQEQHATTFKTSEETYYY